MKKRKLQEDCDDLPKQQQALAAGLTLVEAKWDGNSDFDKGMRLLQKLLRKRGGAR